MYICLIKQMIQFNLKLMIMYILEVCEAAYNGDCTKIEELLRSLTVKGQQNGLTYEEAKSTAKDTFNSIADSYLKSKELVKTNNV